MRALIETTLSVILGGPELPTVRILATVTVFAIGVIATMVQALASCLSVMQRILQQTQSLRIHF